MKRLTALLLILISILTLCSCKIKTGTQVPLEPTIEENHIASKELDNLPYEVEIITPKDDEYPNTNKHYVETDKSPGYILTKYLGEESVVTIPASIDGIKVIKIGNACFSKNNKLTEITIPPSIINIDNYAFYGCENLKKVNLSNGVVEIGDSAFMDCTALTEFQFPVSVENIGICAFSNCTNLKNIIFLEQRELEIEASAFSNTALERVFLPIGTKSIDNAAFLGCKNLKEILIPNTVTSIKKNAFKNSSKVTLFVSKGSYAHDFAVEAKEKYKAT